MLGIFLKATSQRHLDISFSVSTSQTVRVIEAPGRWMSSEDLSALVADLRTVAAKTLPEGELNYGVLGGDPERLNHAIVTLVSQKHEGTPIAFNALARMEVDLGHRSEEVLHLGLVMVDPDARSKGLSWVLYGLTCILMLFRNGLRPLWISNVTQVPAVVGLVSEGFARVFPTAQSAKRESRSILHLLLARRILRDHRHVFGVGSEAGFDEDNFVITNAYTGGSDHLKKTFDQAPKHRDDAVNEFCQQALDYGRGDDLLQLGQIDLPTAFSYIAREVPPKSFAAISIAVSLALLNRFALPIWNWFDTQKDLGLLRARTGS